LPHLAALWRPQILCSQPRILPLLVRPSICECPLPVLASVVMGRSPSSHALHSHQRKANER
jgi:hypothetical protein